jgi:hypothetical protein
MMDAAVLAKETELLEARFGRGGGAALDEEPWAVCLLEAARERTWLRQALVRVLEHQAVMPDGKTYQLAWDALYRTDTRET